MLQQHSEKIELRSRKKRHRPGVVGGVAHLGEREFTEQKIACLSAPPPIWL